MKKTTLKNKILSLLIMLTMLVGTMPLSGIVSFAVGDNEACSHVNNDYDAKCDNCNGFLSDASGEITLGEEMTETLPYKIDGYLYLTFTPSETGTYIIKAVSSESDPVAYVYDSNGNQIAYNDDYGSGRLFYMFSELSAGITYYIALGDYNLNADCTFVIVKKCDTHTPSEVIDCRGTFCSVCYEFFGEGNGNHIPDGEAICAGYYCSVCEEYYGEPAYDHVDEDGNFKCDECYAIVTDLTVTEGEHEIPMVLSDTVYYAFVPTESGYYRFTSASAYDPEITLYSDTGDEIASNDDATNYNFHLTIQLEGGKTYYLGFYEHVNDNVCPVTIQRLCDVHTFGDLLPVQEDYHCGTCVVCGEYYEEEHEFDENGDCECGYFRHEHDYSDYYYDLEEHVTVCSLCGLYSDEYALHEYDENGICICGREIFKDVCLGEHIIVDGEYLDNEGNVSTTAPEGGYAYYKGGVLTLNNFTLVNNRIENPIYGYYAVYSETNISLVIVGDNYLKAMGDDTIHLLDADLTISGDGTLTLVNYAVYDENGDAYVGDGIDVDGGRLTINGGNLIIDASDHGIEVYGDTEINGGTIKIKADDDGMDVDDIVINGGMFCIDAEDNGIDSGNSLTINGGSFYIETEDDDGIEANEVLTINDGTFEINANDESLESIGTIVINGGYLNLNSGEDHAAIIAEEELIISDDLGEFHIDYDDRYYGYVLIDAEDLTLISDIIIKSSHLEEKTLIKNSWVYVNSFITLNNADPSSIVDVMNDDGEHLEEGVDFTVSLDASSLGKQVVIITGIGNYVGTVINTTDVVKPIVINYGETVKKDIPSIVSGDYLLFEFTPEIDATYIISTVSGLSPVIFVYNSSFVLVDGMVSGELTKDVYQEIELEAGETYYFGFAVFAFEDIAGEGEFTLEIICPGHVGGEATYTEQAVCEICGEHYGDKLVCDHMCHKGGIYAIIWAIFDDIYDYFGIETECDCGEKH